MYNFGSEFSFWYSRLIESKKNCGLETQSCQILSRKSEFSYKSWNWSPMVGHTHQILFLHEIVDKWRLQKRASDMDFLYICKSYITKTQTWSIQKSNLEKLELLFKELEYTVRNERATSIRAIVLLSIKNCGGQSVLRHWRQDEYTARHTQYHRHWRSYTHWKKKTQQFFKQIARNQENQLKELLRCETAVRERALLRAFPFVGCPVVPVTQQTPRSQITEQCFHRSKWS